jgi:hypothetical protein
VAASPAAAPSATVPQQGAKDGDYDGPFAPHTAVGSAGGELEN